MPLVKSGTGTSADDGSLGSRPARALSTRAASPTLRVMGPTVSRLQARGYTPCLDMRPKVGLRPTMAQRAAGSLTEPPVSLPRAAMHWPAATAAAEPPLEPPVMRPGFQGLRAGPSWGLMLVAPRANSCICSLPRRMAPARENRSVTAAS